MSRRFGPVRQLGFLVDDGLEHAAAHWAERLGIGPFFVIPEVAMIDPVYRDEPCAARIGIALAYSGELQIELVVQHDEAPSIYREWLAQGRSGLHHLGFFVDDIDAAVESLDPAPARLQHGRNFCYVDTEQHPGTITELIRPDDGMTALFDMIRQASHGWDGSEPVRRLG